ncbi:MAG: long-chain fatty acid--CoA ligase [Ardenticatenaceae bacterium]|nr:long-chain fatty acid--CoA ligase [Ardenticatenaceae bacterium]MCB8990134.1 long-chain fatty acid--CoA ligase [Ardenticatenaceae bacterium]
MHSADLLTKRARLTPDREALLFAETGERFSYAELNERANRAANFLRDQCGIQGGDRVSILAHNGVHYIDLFYGVAKIGAILAPLNWRLVAAELAYIVNDCDPKVLICGPDFVDTLAELRPQINVGKFISLEGAEIEGALSYEDGVAEASGAEPERPSTLSGETPHCILYTSGTTGRPKGAIIPQRQVLWNILNTCASWGLTERDVSPVFTPLFHAGGLFAFLTPLLYLGGRIVLYKGFDPDTTLDIILEEKCTVILGVPTLFQMWLDAPNFADLDFSHVHFFISGGAPCPPVLMEKWRKAKNIIFRQGYGLTEVGPNCFTMTDEDSVPKTGSVGRPIFHSDMRLVDEQGNDVPVGETGELLIKGPHVCAGYWRNPEATVKSLVDGWFYTGDTARMDADGFFTIVGRSKDMIISGGENIYAAEVEAVFLEHTAVTGAALIGKPHEKWGEVGLMIVVTDKNQTVTDDELITHCHERLARYKAPKEIIFADDLPYSPYGKVMKNVLREKYL